MERRNKKIKYAALQASCSRVLCRIKRVLSSILLKEKGSLTLEASLVLSLFVFASVCLMLPMQMLDVQRKVQTVLEVTGEDMSKYLYLQFRGDTEGDSQTETEKYEQQLSRLLAAGYLKNKIIETVGDRRIENLDVSGTKVMEDGEHVELWAEYRYVMPFSILGLDSIPLAARSVKRVWIGRQGGTRVGDGSGEANEDPLVYVGRTRGRYHWFRDCHYLDNKITVVSWDSLDGLRNQSGSRYKSCRICGGGTGGTVYIMESGESYHRNRYCTSIVAYVEAVPLSQVESLGACSYCRRMKGE